MATWIVLRGRTATDADTGVGAEVVGSVTAAEELAARIAAHARWLDSPQTRVQLVPLEAASAEQRRAGRTVHVNVEEERNRLHAIFENRLFL
jgi:hypothetical protein